MQYFEYFTSNSLHARIYIDNRNQYSSISFESSGFSWNILFSIVLWWQTNRLNHFCMCCNLHLFFLQGKKSSKTSILSLMYCIVLSMILFYWRVDDDVAVSRTCKPVDTMYFHLLKQDVYSLYLFTRFDIKCFATNIFLSIDVLIWRISRLSFSMAIHYQTYSEPTLILVSSTINSKILVFL